MCPLAEVEQVQGEKAQEEIQGQPQCICILESLQVGTSSTPSFTGARTAILHSLYARN